MPRKLKSVQGSFHGNDTEYQTSIFQDSTTLYGLETSTNAPLNPFGPSPIENAPYNSGGQEYLFVLGEKEKTVIFQNRPNDRPDTCTADSEKEEDGKTVEKTVGA